MILLDTSFLVAFFNEEDSQHQKALEDMKNVEKEIQLLSNYVALETATVLRNKKDLRLACDFLEGIRAKDKLRIYTLNELDFEGTYKIFRNQKSSLSFIDASIVYLALETNSKIATYDSDISDEIKRLKASDLHR
ncbi:PIN domain-containing protein [Candidatus Micrarchaeota archaeon]|nr:PIN domain-containing protein [Candidatus Micrarchaeota archaeon]